MAKMVFLYKRQNIAKKKGKIRIGYQCLGCETKYRTRKKLEKHQEQSWPGCPTSYKKDIAILSRI